LKPVFADGGIDLVLFHDSMLTRRSGPIHPGPFRARRTS
jgi:hypothetical protein